MEEDRRVKITIVVQSPNGLDPGVPDWLESGLRVVWDLEVEGVEVEEGSGLGLTEHDQYVRLYQTLSKLGGSESVKTYSPQAGGLEDLARMREDIVDLQMKCFGGTGLPWRDWFEMREALLESLVEVGGRDAS